MSEVCGDNRFELIGEFKDKLVEGTNIETSPEEMAVLDNILFRFWQMGWLDLLKAQEPRVMTLEEAQAITCPGALVWLESTGGYEGTRYGPIAAIISDNTHGLLPEDAMHFYNTAARTWSGYNKTVCGWRLWTSEPTHKQKEAVKWDD